MPRFCTVSPCGDFWCFFNPFFYLKLILRCASICFRRACGCSPRFTYHWLPHRVLLSASTHDFCLLTIGTRSRAIHLCVRRLSLFRNCFFLPHFFCAERFPDLPFPPWPSFSQTSMFFFIIFGSVFFSCDSLFRFVKISFQSKKICCEIDILCTALEWKQKGGYYRCLSLHFSYLFFLFPMYVYTYVLHMSVLRSSLFVNIFPRVFPPRIF